MFGNKLLICKVFDIQNGADLIVWWKLDEVLDRSALALFLSIRDLINLQPVTPSFLGKEHKGMVCTGNKQVFNIILFPCFSAHGAPAPSFLDTVLGCRSSLDISEMRHRYHHIFFFDQVFQAHLIIKVGDLTAAFVSKLLLHFAQFRFDQFIPQSCVCKQGFQVGDQFHDLCILFLDLIDLHSREPLQPEVKHGAGLYLRHPELADKPFPGLFRCGTVADQFDHFVQVVQRNKITLKDMRFFLSFLQLVSCPANDHFVTEVNKFCDHVFQVQGSGPSPY